MIIFVNPELMEKVGYPIVVLEQLLGKVSHREAFFLVI